jgi:hypothetical protein
MARKSLKIIDTAVTLLIILNNIETISYMQPPGGVGGLNSDREAEDQVESLRRVFSAESRPD